MLSYFSPSRKHKTTTTSVAVVKESANDSKLFPLRTMFNEAARRDAAIKALVARLEFGEGDTCEAYTEGSREEYGPILVEKICKTYAQYGRKEKWPENDTPMIITCFSEKMNNRFICTPGFLRKVPK